jgi:methylamine dehydrogenase heavy chain
MMTVTIDRHGELENRERSQPFFDVRKDPVTEKSARWGDHWLFPSFEGYIYPVDVSGKKPEFEDKWSLLSDAERADNWRMGGMHYTAVHQKSNTLYVLMHQGGTDTIADPGQEVWVYDLESRKRTRKIMLENLAWTIQVTQDSDPILVTGFLGPNIEVYDAKTGALLRTVDSGANAPVNLVTP